MRYLSIGGACQKEEYLRITVAATNERVQEAVQTGTLGIPELKLFDLFDRGEFFDFVGQSRGGQSTISSLFARFFDPDQGVITTDGTPFEEFDLLKQLNASLESRGSTTSLKNCRMDMSLNPAMTECGYRVVNVSAWRWHGRY